LFAAFSTMVQPAASAGAIFHAAISSGKFHGMIWPTTPTGPRTVYDRYSPGSDRGSVEPVILVAQPPMQRNISTASGRSATRATAFGLPLSIDSSSASSFRSRSIRSAMRHRIRPRSDGLILPQRLSSNARRAAATAKSPSALSPSDTLAITPPVAGLHTAKVLPETAPTILPSISIRGVRPR